MTNNQYIGFYSLMALACFLVAGGIWLLGAVGIIVGAGAWFLIASIIHIVHGIGGDQ